MQITARITFIHQDISLYHQVDGSCGFYQKPPFIDTDWVACLNKERDSLGNDMCPLGLTKVDDGNWCNKDRVDSVCCLLQPKLKFNVNLNFYYISSYRTVIIIRLKERGISRRQHRHHGQHKRTDQLTSKEGGIKRTLQSLTDINNYRSHRSFKYWKKKISSKTQQNWNRRWKGTGLVRLTPLTKVTIWSLQGKQRQAMKLGLWIKLLK